MYPSTQSDTSSLNSSSTADLVRESPHGRPARRDRRLPCPFRDAPVLLRGALLRSLLRSPPLRVAAAPPWLRRRVPPLRAGARRGTFDRSAYSREARSYREELTALRERIFTVLVPSDPEELRDRLEAAVAELGAGGSHSTVVPLIAAWNAASLAARKKLVAESCEKIVVFSDHFEATFRIGIPEPVAWPFHYPTRRRRSDETIPALECHGFGKIGGTDSVKSSRSHRTLTPKKWAARPMANVR
jgi:hypothetical protein